MFDLKKPNRLFWTDLNSDKSELFSLKGGDPSADSPTDTLLRLHPSHNPYHGQLPILRIGTLTSGTNYFHGVTGGVYKTRERIHRSLLICDY